MLCLSFSSDRSRIGTARALHTSGDSVYAILMSSILAPVSNCSVKFKTCVTAISLMKRPWAFAPIFPRRFPTVVTNGLACVRVQTKSYVCVCVESIRKRHSTALRLSASFVVESKLVLSWLAGRGISAKGRCPRTGRTCFIQLG